MIPTDKNDKAAKYLDGSISTFRVLESLEIDCPSYIQDSPENLTFGLIQ
nr:7044_t:CDS:2 [Entrophospora candida]